jgi:hypothetical protein
MGIGRAFALVVLLNTKFLVKEEKKGPKSNSSFACICMQLGCIRILTDKGSLLLEKAANNFLQLYISSLSRKQGYKIV